MDLEGRLKVRHALSTWSREGGVSMGGAVARLCMEPGPPRV
jgi:hypothetical protein